MIETLLQAPAMNRKSASLPKLGFLGVGWIGRSRMEAVAKKEAAGILAIAEPSPELAAKALELAPKAQQAASLDELLEMDLDGIVIATPSALHAEQSIKALERGMAVFCQKPLGRNGAETKQVIAAAKASDRLLGVDLSYRYLSGAQKIRDLIQSGDLGHIFAADLVFHNAYGPDKPWFYNRAMSGGGCVIDLGIHLVDLAIWILNSAGPKNVESRLLAGGKPMHQTSAEVEDYALARIDLEEGSSLQLACSWRLPAGKDAIIRAAFYGTKGGAELTNINGSFYDFEAYRYRGTSKEVLSSGPEAWGGGAILEWTRKLQVSSAYDPRIESLLPVANTLDEIFNQGTRL
ncbi:MAG: Gfo/Idh/MocA family protein [Verrucomicrobiales bacterium]